MTPSPSPSPSRPPPSRPSQPSQPLRCATRRSLALTALAALLAAGCADGSGASSPRTFRGAVHVANVDGTQKTELSVDEGYPRVQLDSLFYVEFVGTARGATYRLAVTINPANEGQRYEMPRDKAQVTVDVSQNGTPLPLSNISGFLEQTKADTVAAFGSGVISLEIFGASGFALADIDVTFQTGPRGQ